MSKPTRTRFHSDVTPHQKNFKWKVEIEVCEVGHRYVPVQGKCLECVRKKYISGSSNR